jgi:hypothetical protein
MSKTVNRCLNNKAFDRIDHALGRPVDPLAVTYREYYAAGKDSQIAAEMRRSDYWEEGNTSGTLTYIFVTLAGRHALRDHLRAIGDPHRFFEVQWEGHAHQFVAKSRGNAKYQAYLSASDAFCDLTFREFFRTARVFAMGGQA